jgi:energy-converting hydrogenase Eha subunit H
MTDRRGERQAETGPACEDNTLRVLTAVFGWWTLIAMAVTALALASGCSTVSGMTSVTAQRDVYAIKSDYQAALVVAVAYRRLPACGGAAVVCSTPSVVAKLQAADRAARAALDTAESTVRSSSDASAVSNAVGGAQGAVASFVSLVQTLKQ